jgi:hypothetical protein
VIHLRLTRDPARNGGTNEWTCVVTHQDTDLLWRPGIGRTRTEALGSFVRANLEALGITEIEDIDPEESEANRVVTWTAARNGE